MGNALNVSVPAQLCMGDKAVAFGYVSDYDKGRAWNAHLMEEVGNGMRVGRLFFRQKNLHIKRDEFLFDEFQVMGMWCSLGKWLWIFRHSSGHVTHTNKNNYPVALVIPAAYVVKCLEKNRKMLADFGDCPGINVIQVKTSLYGMCNNLKL